MSMGIIIAEAVIFSILFTVMGFVTTGKKSKLQVHNYPPEIQEEYFKTHERIAVQPLSGRVIALKSVGILIFTGILAVCAYVAGAETFADGFGLASGLMVWIGAYDTFFLDWVLFANMKRFRLEGTEHMDKEYRQKWFHVKGMLFPGIVFALIPAVLVGAIVSFLPK
ncbi:MAG: hypothetical protein NC427_02235 [Ruminococcus flavefaciens]|nr:hypothetical protein [Ruminococcus flavefaciens]